MHEVVKMNPVCQWRQQGVSDVRAMSICKRELHTGSGNSLGVGGTDLAGSKVGRAKLSKLLTSNMELQDLVFSMLGFCLALVYCFLTTLPFLPFGMAMYILCHYMLDLCDVFDFHFIGGYS